MEDSEDRARILRQTLFNLAKFIREEQFAEVFLKGNGLFGLVKIISNSHGNILAVRIDLASFSGAFLPILY